MSDLIRSLTPDEATHKYVQCCWYSKDCENCVRLPMFRLATPHGHQDFCDDHIDYMIASLPADWLAGFEYREPVLIDSGDDIPF